MTSYATRTTTATFAVRPARKGNQGNTKMAAGTTPKRHVVRTHFFHSRSNGRRRYDHNMGRGGFRYDRDMGLGFDWHNVRHQFSSFSFGTDLDSVSMYGVRSDVNLFRQPYPYCSHVTRTHAPSYGGLELIDSHISKKPSSIQTLDWEKNRTINISNTCLYVTDF